MSKYQTNQKKLLLEYFSNNHDKLLSVSQISQDLKNSGISLSSIYRYVLELENEGKLKRYSKSGDKSITYQFIGLNECEGQIHLSCTKCGKSEHLSEEQAKSFIGLLAKLNHFSINASETVIYGVCKNCK